jgi:hypothetical protein
MTEDEIGRAAHAAWKRDFIGRGWPDHWPPGMVFGEHEWVCSMCGRPERSHDRHMVSWDDLAEYDRHRYIVQGMAGYEARGAEEDGHWELIQHLRNEANAARSAQETEWRAKLSWKERAEAAEAEVAALTAQVAALEGELERITGSKDAADAYGNLMRHALEWKDKALALEAERDQMEDEVVGLNSSYDRLVVQVARAEARVEELARGIVLDDGGGGGNRHHPECLHDAGTTGTGSGARDHPPRLPPRQAASPPHRGAGAGLRGTESPGRTGRGIESWRGHNMQRSAADGHNRLRAA